MEYIQAVLFRIPAENIEEASRPHGLFAELDEHREYLEQLAGFQDMRVIRSINTEGEIQLVVESRWQDDESLIGYETQEPNGMSIINKYRDIIVPGSLQVADMEAVRPQEKPEPVPGALERISLPLLVPAGVLAFALLVIYGLSRIYLEIRSEEIGDLSVATPLAAGIAAGILGVAWYLATHPRVSGWQIASIGVAALALLLGGAIFAAVHEEPGEAAPPAVTSPTPTVSPPAGGGPAAVSIAMVPTIKFDQTELTIAANQDVTVEADNRDTGILHNFAVYRDSSASELLGKTEICTAPCKGSVTLNLPPGEYFFRCDVHPTQMTGTLTVQ